MAVNNRSPSRNGCEPPFIVARSVLLPYDDLFQLYRDGRRVTEFGNSSSAIESTGGEVIITEGGLKIIYLVNNSVLWK